MAINITDFDKIWASTSPLTPYAFSDANYQQGWNFIGATPPARQMWDSYMKLSDEKSQWLYNNKLSLSGGTMAGQIKTSFGDFIANTNDAQYIRINGGTDANNGASIILFGKDNSSAGEFYIRARNGSTIKDLKGKPDGALTWDSKSVIVGTEASETFTFNLNANESKSVGTLAHVPKYYSLYAGGSGFANCVFNMSTSGTVWCYNLTGVARTDMTVTVNYIY